MNAELLHEIAAELAAELDRSNLIGQMASLVNALNNLATNPGAPPIQHEIAGLRTSLDGALRDSPIDSFPPLWLSALEDLGVRDFLGERLLSQLFEIFLRNEITPAAMVGELQPILERLTQLRQSLDQITNGLAGLGIARLTLADGQAEVSVLIPREALANSLRRLAEEFRALEGLLDPFNELAIGSRPPIDVEGIASSAFLLLLFFSPYTAVKIAETINKVLESYKNILEIRRLRQELLDAGTSESTVDAVTAEHKERLETRLDEIALEVVNDAHLDDEGRVRELHTAMQLTVRGIADRVDRGFSFDVRAGDPPTDGSEEEHEGIAEAVLRIRQLQPNLGFLRLQGGPILELRSGDDASNNGGPPQY